MLLRFQAKSLNCVYLPPLFPTALISPPPRASPVLPVALKAKHHAHARMHTAEESRNDYAAQLQKYNKEQNYFYYTEIPQIFNVSHLREDAAFVCAVVESKESL